jgi:hypothetical protein
MQILRGIIFLILLLISSVGFSGEVKPNQEKTTPEIINKHIQDNYKLKVIQKINLILTGFIISDNDKSIGNRAYTSFKVEF